MPRHPYALTMVLLLFFVAGCTQTALTDEQEEHETMDWNRPPTDVPRGSVGVLEIPGVSLNQCTSLVLFATVPRALIDLPYDSPWHDDGFQYHGIYTYEFVCQRYAYQEVDAGPVSLVLEGVAALNVPAPCGERTSRLVFLRTIYTDDLTFGQRLGKTLGVDVVRTKFEEPGGSLPLVDYVRTWTPDGYTTSTWQAIPSRGEGRAYAETTIFLAHNETHSSRLHLDYTFEQNTEDDDYSHAAFEEPMLLSYAATDDYATRHAFRRDVEASGTIDVWSNTQCGP